MSGFLSGTVEYRKFLGDADDYTAEYAAYRLENVLVREIFSFGEENERDAGTVVYFFPGRSVCLGLDGEECEFPRPARGDLCILHGGTDAEYVARVAEAGYFSGQNGIGHVRLKLK